MLTRVVDLMRSILCMLALCLYENLIDVAVEQFCVRFRHIVNKCLCGYASMHK